MPNYQSPAVSTPLVVRARGPREVSYKMECDQPSGSFKLRGLGALCADHAARGCEQVVTSSGGNAGLAVAYSARRLGLDATVFVPEVSGPSVERALAAAGARVCVHGLVWDETDVEARKYAAANAATYVHPFDHPLIWNGHADIIREAADQGARPDSVLVSVGGGGLLLGILQGLREVGWDVPVFAVETHGAASLAAALAAGESVDIGQIESVAHSLGARRVAEACISACADQDVRPIQLADSGAVRACLDFLTHENRLVEPACGAALAALDHLELASHRHPLVIVCGGTGVSREQLEHWAKTLPS